MRGLHGSHNRMIVVVSGTVVVNDIAPGESTGDVRVDFGSFYKYLNGEEVSDLEDLELAIWTPPSYEPQNGFTIAISGQDSTGFYVNATRIDDGYFETSDLELDWEIRGIQA